MFRLAFATSVAGLALVPCAEEARAEKSGAPGLAGTYRCSPNPTPCAGETFTVTQSGTTMEFKGGKDLDGRGIMTSPTTISVIAPWNVLGIVRDDGRIDWSNGTIWRKQ